eukprot:807957-Pleurochrysis_carterae.AAC.1
MGVIRHGVSLRRRECDPNASYSPQGEHLVLPFHRRSGLFEWRVVTRCGTHTPGELIANHRSRCLAINASRTHHHVHIMSPSKARMHAQPSACRLYAPAVFTVNHRGRSGRPRSRPLRRLPNLCGGQRDTARAKSYTI